MTCFGYTPTYPTYLNLHHHHIHTLELSVRGPPATMFKMISRTALLPGDSKIGGCRAAVERWCAPWRKRQQIPGSPTRSVGSPDPMSAARGLCAWAFVYSSRAEEIRSAPAWAAAR
ncbi:hypothetical protein SETIT_5G362300v2 [Setaria italica]|uniref:Uncharacterized protein n=1 Tax=Setaria italica TaxID=4555 RepID=A0A368RCK9_SETIT|nr:hypothetical protein SETIT_5G362300v2 [Setaria italica]